MKVLKTKQEMLSYANSPKPILIANAFVNRFSSQGIGLDTLRTLSYRKSILSSRYFENLPALFYEGEFLKIHICYPLEEFSFQALLQTLPAHGNS